MLAKPDNDFVAVRRRDRDQALGVTPDPETLRHHAAARRRCPIVRGQRQLRDALAPLLEAVRLVAVRDTMARAWHPDVEDHSRGYAGLNVSVFLMLISSIHTYR